MAGVLGLAIVLVFAARMAVIALAWIGHNPDLADMRAVIAPVEPGSRVLAVTTYPAPVPQPIIGPSVPISRQVLRNVDATAHLPALLLLQQHAFWPTMFTSDTLQPVHVRPPYKALSVPQGMLPPATALTAPTARDLALSPYLADWRQNFDYVLLMRPGALKAPLVPDALTPIRQADIAALYRVRK